MEDSWSKDCLFDSHCLQTMCRCTFNGKEVLDAFDHHSTCVGETCHVKKTLAVHGLVDQQQVKILVWMTMSCHYVAEIWLNVM